MADVLVDSGAARYDTNPRHRRASLLAITADGVASLRTIQAAQRAWSARVGEELGEADLARAAELLDRAEQLVARELPTLQQ